MVTVRRGTVALSQYWQTVFKLESSGCQPAIISSSYKIAAQWWHLLALESTSSMARRSSSSLVPFGYKHSASSYNEHRSKFPSPVGIEKREHQKWSRHERIISIVCYLSYVVNRKIATFFFPTSFATYLYPIREICYSIILKGLISDAFVSSSRNKCCKCLFATD